MIYFSFTDLGDAAPAMTVLDATDDQAALDEARAHLKAYPGAARAHVYNGDAPVGSVEAPEFGFAGVNNTIGQGSHPTDPEPAPALSPDAAGPGDVSFSVPTRRVQAKPSLTVVAEAASR